MDMEKAAALCLASAEFLALGIMYSQCPRSHYFAPVYFEEAKACAAEARRALGIFDGVCREMPA